MIKNLKLGRLELIAFVGGSVVMVLELIGARILAPYLGNSIFVWTSIIGIILAALSLGYHLGGRLSAQKPTLQTLAGILLVAGVLITITAIIKTPILELASNLGVRGGSVVATLLLFAPASVILGMISPYAIRLKITDVESSGGVAGNLYAISTIGSIVGTFLAGFVLVPLFGSSQLLYGLSGVLILTSLVGGARALPIVLLAGVAAASFVGPAPDSNLVYEADSSYNHIRVVDFTDRDNQDLRALYLATETHSIIFRDSKEVYAEYHKL